MAVGRTNYNGTTTTTTSTQVAPPMASRQRFFFKAVGGDMTLNFSGGTATASNILTVPSGASVSLTNQDPYDIRGQINVYAAGNYAYEAQAEELTS